jgi:ABC-type amino acid transport substrate-binding protein
MKKFNLIAIMVGLMFLLSCGKKPKGYVVGVTTGTTYQEMAEKLSNVEQVKTLINDNFTLQELADERVDAVITDRLLGLVAIKKSGFDNLELAGNVLYNETIAVAINEKDDSLRQAVNNALAEIIADGTYESISKKYFGKDILNGFTYKQTYTDEEKASDDSLQRVLDAGEIKFAMSGGYPPFNYYEKDELTGFDVEIGKAVAKKLGVKYTPVTTDWNGIIEGLRSGRFDGIFGSMAVTAKREEVVDFTNPYYYSGAQLIVKKGSDIKNIDTLK